MIQDYEKYVAEDQEIWKILFSRQDKNLKDKASSAYLKCLEEISAGLHAEAIPKFTELDRLLTDRSGWSIEVVKGLIPVEDFFELLSRKRFCSSTWLRTRAQLDYLEEPDMFHDIFGHIPLFMDQTYAAFVHEFGKIGTRYASDEVAVLKMKRLYWFTIEFGLLAENGINSIYGAGIISSFGESNRIFEDEIEFQNFELEAVLEQDFRTDILQSKYYVINSIDQLYNSLDQADQILSKKVAQPKIYHK